MVRSGARCLAIVLIVTGLRLTSDAQEAKPAFAVASVRRSLPGGPGGATITGRGDTLRVTRTPLHRMVLTAYGIREDLLVGGPAWIHRDLFDISAKAETEVTGEVSHLMFQSLLEDRFGLVLRQERRQRDIYALKLARTDGRLGPDLRKVPDDCRRPTIGEYVDRMPKASSGARPSFLGACSAISMVVQSLERMLQTTVLDETGLTGKWDYVVAHGGLSTTTSVGPNGDAEDRPSVFVAVKEQLGLTLERRKGTVDVLVIASVHPPTEN